MKPASKRKAVMSPAIKQKVAINTTRKKTTATTPGNKQKTAKTGARKRTQVAAPGRQQKHAKTNTGKQKTTPRQRKPATTQVKRRKRLTITATKQKTARTTARKPKTATATVKQAKPTPPPAKQRKPIVNQDKKPKPTTTSTRKRKATDFTIPPAKWRRKENFNMEIKKVIAEVKEEIFKENKPNKPIVDVMFKRINPSVMIYKDYSCILTQVNLEKGSTKFHRMQVGVKDKSFLNYSRWSKESKDTYTKGRHRISTTNFSEAAVANFKTKFKAETKNDWDERHNFKIQKGKLAFVEEDDEPDVMYKWTIPDLVSHEELMPSETDCSLPYRTQLMIAQLIYAELVGVHWCKQFEEFYSWAHQKLAKAQLIRGLEVLLDIEEAINNKKPRQILTDLSEKFYALLPCPKASKCLVSTDDIKRKTDIILFMTNIDSSQFGKVERTNPDIYPLLEAYQMLNCEIELLDKSNSEFKMLEEYASATACLYSLEKTVTLLDIWRVDCKAERARFKDHHDVKNRKMLWHRLCVRDIAGVLRDGIKKDRYKGEREVFFNASCIPDSCHDGELTFGEEYEVSYICLAEVALGTEFDLFKYKYPKELPEGYDSFNRRGSDILDDNKSKSIKLNGKDVMIPVWKPEPGQRRGDLPERPNYIIFDKSRARVRYLFKFKHV